MRNLHFFDMEIIAIYTGKNSDSYKTIAALFIAAYVQKN
jgi:uncharacterized MAPEG superfamily protein